MTTFTINTNALLLSVLCGLLSAEVLCSCISFALKSLTKEEVMWYVYAETLFKASLAIWAVFELRAMAV